MEPPSPLPAPRPKPSALPALALSISPANEKGRREAPFSFSAWVKNSAFRANEVATATAKLNRSPVT